MARLVGARDRVTMLMAEDAVDVLLALAGIDDHALRTFSLHVGGESDRLGTSPAAAFSAGFLIALMLVVEEAGAES